MLALLRRAQDEHEARQCAAQLLHGGGRVYACERQHEAAEDGQGFGDDGGLADGTAEDGGEGVEHARVEVAFYD